MPGVVLNGSQAEGGPSPAEEKKSTGEEATQEKERTKNDAPASRAVVGIIYPPPEVRSIRYLQ